MIASAVLLGVAVVIFCTWGLQNLKRGLPLLIGLRGRFWFDGTPEMVTNTQWDARTQEVIADLENLGFKPLGIKVERFLHGTTREISFAAPGHCAFASIYGY